MTYSMMKMKAVRPTLKLKIFTKEVTLFRQRIRRVIVMKLRIMNLELIFELLCQCYSKKRPMLKTLQNTGMLGYAMPACFILKQLIVSFQSSPA